MTSSSPSPASPQAERYVLLRADDLRLLLPQAEVGAAEYLAGQLEPLDDNGLMHQPERDDGAMFVALSAQMVPLKEAPQDRFVTTTLGEGADGLYWCWNEVRVLKDADVVPQALPQALRAPYSPITDFAMIDDEVAFLCTAAGVADYALAQRS